MNTLYNMDCVEFMKTICADKFDTIFADPPYFLSNGGTTCHGGKRTVVDKGEWDKGGVKHAWNVAWLGLCQEVLTDNGTIWVSGTHHNIFSIGYAMQELGYKILNTITWEKPNPPPNLSCRFFTHSTETIIWAAKNGKSKHYFDYAAMKEANGGKQMKDVWRFTSGRHKIHPCEKPVSLLKRLLLASTPPGGMVLDPFMGSGSTGVAAQELGLDFYGCEIDEQYYLAAKERLRGGLEILEG